MLPEFELLMPQTLPEALAMLAERAPDALPLAGGTSLLVDMRAGICRPGMLVNLGRLEELRAIERENGHIRLGAGVTIAEVLDSSLIAQVAPALHQSAGLFANPLVRNRATVGGNLAYGSPAADTAPPLLVLDAEMKLACEGGQRSVPLEDFLTGVRKTVRRPDELVTALRWPVLPTGALAAFRKLALRKADAISVVSVAALLVPGTSGSDREVRIALGAVAPTPIRARAAEAALRDQPLTEEHISEAAFLAGEATCCITDIRGSEHYRRRVTEALVRRVLGELAGGSLA